MVGHYFDEIMEVVSINNQVVFDKVCRINAKGVENDSSMEFDVNSELYPMLPGEKYRMVISKTLLMDGPTIPGYAPEGKQKSLADEFDYVMHGLLYNISEAREKTNHGYDDLKVVVYISFGGLKLMLKGHPLKMHEFSVDQKLFLLLRKI